MSETFKPVAYTSKIMAAIRAVEHERPNRLFTDPYAAELAGEDTIIKAISKIQENEDKGMPYVEVRTRYFDDWLKSIANKIKQIVILGAGLDTRAYRINLPANIHLYELDQAEVIEYKNTILHKYSSSCHRVSLASDLRKVWSENLISAGYQTNVPTAWLIEGLFYYLTEEEVKNILEQINKLSLANSYLAADFINKANLKPI